jgi:hypothetical protein
MRLFENHFRDTPFLKHEKPENVWSSFLNTPSTQVSDTDLRGVAAKLHIGNVLRGCQHRSVSLRASPTRHRTQASPAIKTAAGKNKIALFEVRRNCRAANASPAVVTIGTIQGGTRGNIVAESVHMTALFERMTKKSERRCIEMSVERRRKLPRVPVQKRASRSQVFMTSRSITNRLPSAWRRF